MSPELWGNLLPHSSGDIATWHAHGNLTVSCQAGFGLTGNSQVDLRDLWPSPLSLFPLKGRQAQVKKHTAQAKHKIAVLEHIIMVSMTSFQTHNRPKAQCPI